MSEYEGKYDKNGWVKTTPERKRDHAHEEKVTYPSGASTSAVSARYDLICPVGLRRIAERYGLGASKHGEYNWCMAGSDKEFQRARLNHLIKHLVHYLEVGDNGEDDDLAAIAWGAIALIHYSTNCKHHEVKLP